MNELIEKLSDKAIENMPGAWNIPDEFCEKFAELIVQECLNQCYNNGMNDELYSGQLKAAKYIEQHFGVE